MGVGGFGKVHVSMNEDLRDEGLVEVVAFAEPNREAPEVASLRQSGAEWYQDYVEMLEREDGIDLVCIAVPIPLHLPAAEAAFKRGSHVYLEKPPVVRIQDLHHLIRAQEEAGVYCAVGFQDMARPTSLALKRALCSGELGQLRAIHAHARWHRNDAYYTRTPWAGKALHEGAYVLDGPMNNACAHMLNLCAFLAGADMHGFARPLWVRGELYRAAAVENEDTNCLRALMDTGVELCIHLTQAAPTHHPREYHLIGDEGEALLRDQDGVHLPERFIPWTEPEQAGTTLLRRLVEVIRDTDEPLVMPLAEAEGYVLLSNGAYESAGQSIPIPEEHLSRVVVNGEQATVVTGIEDAMKAAAEAGKLLSEHGLPWARATEPFDLAGYESFPQRWTPPAG